MRNTGGDKRRRVEICIIDSLCKQLFLIANHIHNMTADGTYKKRNSNPNQVTRAVSFFFYKFTRKYTQQVHI